VILAHLDRLLTSARITGYTVEEDARYLRSETPTLTYRMYAEGAESHRNLGEFAAAMAELGSTMRLSRVWGAVSCGEVICRSRQLCLTAELASERALVRALDVVYRRFTAGPTAAPGSWRHPDVRVSGGLASNAEAAYAHWWPQDGATVVALTTCAVPPADGARTCSVQVLRSWPQYLDRSAVEAVPGDGRSASATP
jgi:hypothetical protein